MNKCPLRPPGGSSCLFSYIDYSRLLLGEQVQVVSVFFYYVCRLDKWRVFVLVSVFATCRECTCNEPSRYVLIPCTHSRGLMRFVARPRWWGWCMSTMTWGDAGWSFPWQIWMLCPRFTHQTGWDCHQVSSSKHRCLSRRALTSFTPYRVFQKMEAQKYHLTLLAHGSQQLKHPPLFPVRTLHLRFSQVKDQRLFLHNRCDCQMYQWIWIILEWDDLEKVLI